MNEIETQIKEVFPERFLKLLGNQSIDTLCAEIGISKPTVRAWLAKRSFPRLKTFIKLCKFFNCKLDYFANLD